MTRKPTSFEWFGFTDEQVRLLNLIDQVGNNGRARNGHSEALMPTLLGTCAAQSLSLTRIKQAMADIGYHKEPLHMLDRWEAKRVTGKVGE